MDKIQLRKIPTIGQAISDSFALMGRNFKDLFYALFLIGGPIFLLFSLFAGLTISMPQFMDSNSFPIVFGISVFITILLGILGFGLFYTILLKYVKLYVHSSDEQVDRTALKEGIWGESVKIIGAVIVSVIMIMGGFICCIIPGIYISYILQVLYPVIIEEQLSIGDAIRRCFKLVEGHWGTTFGFFLVIGFIINAASYIIQIPLFLVVELSDVIGLTNLGVIALASAFFTAGFFLLMALLMSIQAMAGSVWYYGLAEQLDGTSSLDALDQIGKQQDEEKKRMVKFRHSPNKNQNKKKRLILLK